MLRRPPRPPLPPSAHDVLREARLLGALAGTPVRVPRVLLAHEDESALGVPFYVMDVVDGVVFHDELPPELDTPAERGRDRARSSSTRSPSSTPSPPPEGLGGPTGYLERQLRRFAGLWELTRTRELPLVEEVHRRLEATMPESPPVDHRPRRLPARQHDVLDRRRRPACSRSSTGSSPRSATRSPTSATSPRPGPSPTRPRRSAPHPSRRARASRRRTSSSRATRRSAAAGSSGSPGTRRSRCGRRRSSSRATTSASSPARPTTRTTRSSTPACRRSPKRPGSSPQPRGRGIPALRCRAWRGTIKLAGR